MTSDHAKHPYFHGLDIIRFTAAMAVAAYHFDAASHGLAVTFWWGWVGVEMFFLLSGAVIANSAEGSGFKHFVVGRILRLYPAAFACAAINLALLLMRRPLESLDYIKLFASVTLIPKGGFLFISGYELPNLGFLAGAYWTLPIEIVFYSLVALMILAGASNRLNRLALWLGSISGIFIVALALSTAGLFYAPKLNFEHGMLNLTLLRHGVFFAGGILLARRFRHGLSRGEVFFLIAFIVLGTIETMAAGAHPDHASGGPTGSWSAILVPAAIFVSNAVLTIIAMSGNAVIERSLARFHSPLRLMGLLTYPLYLIHQNIALTLKAYVGATFPAPLFMAVGLVLTLLLATVVALAAEPPMRRALRRLLTGRSSKVSRSLSD